MTGATEVRSRSTSARNRRPASVTASVPSASRGCIRNSPPVPTPPSTHRGRP